MKTSFLSLITCLYTVCIFAQLNIVVIESDDQSNQAIGAFGNPSMVTPNMDSLAKEGTSFTAAYNMGCWSPAVCIPSRTMFFYGQYLWDSQKINKNNVPISLPEILKNNGYTTYMTGKWHAMGNSAKDIFDKTGSIQPGQLKTYYTDKGHVTDITGQEAVNYINEYNIEEPFFLYVAFNAPHVPRQTSQDYYDLYPTSEIKLPPSMVDGMPLNKNVKYQYAPDPLKAKTMKERVQQNNAMVSHMDDRIGDIVKALKNKGIYDNTIIVFMSDHGINFGENGVAGKVCLYEPSVTAPLIIKAPGIAANKQINDRVYLQDITPTLLDLLKIDIPSTIQFKSLLPVIERNETIRESIYLGMFDDQRGLVSGSDKIIMYPKTGVLEYYNLSKDPWEINNIANVKSNHNKIRSLLKDFEAWQTKVGDTINISSFYSNLE